MLEQKMKWWGRASDIHLRPLPQCTLAFAPAASRHLLLGRSSLQLTASLHNWAADKVFHRATATFSVITWDCSILKDDDLFEPRLKTGHCHWCVLCPRRSKWSFSWNWQLIYHLLIYFIFLGIWEQSICYTTVTCYFSCTVFSHHVRTLMPTACATLNTFWWRL